jgi:acyl carrier protein
MNVNSTASHIDIPARAHRAANDIQDWLVDYIAKIIKTSPDQIQVQEDFVNLGLSSRDAVAMMDDLEKFVSKPVDPGLVWEYPNIRSLSDFLGQAT